MKAKAITITAILMLITVSVFSQVNNEGSTDNKVWTSMTLSGQNRVELRLIKPADVNVMLSVYNDTHERVFSKRITGESNLLIAHDISNFPSGVYTYEVTRGKEKLMETKIKKSTGKTLEYMPETSMAEAGKE